MKNQGPGKQMVFAGAAFGLAMGGVYYLAFSAPLAFLVPMTLFSGGGFGGMMYLFARRQGAKLPGLIAQAFGNEEPILRFGGVNHFRGAVAVGGHLFLTGRRLRFISHPYNLKWNHDESFDLADVLRVEECRTLGIVPNGFAVMLRDGRRERFVVTNRLDWIEAIHALRAQNPDGATAQLMGHVPDSSLVVPKAPAASRVPK